MESKKTILVMDEGAFSKEKKEDLYNFSHVIAHYLKQELLKDKDIVLKYYKLPSKFHSLTLSQQLEEFKKIDLKGVNHIIGLAVRFFSRVKYDAVNYLASNISGLVTQTYERPRSDIKIFTFCFSSLEEKNPYYLRIGWGADPRFCYPQQNPEVLTLLIDHSNRGNPVDLSEKLSKAVYEFSKDKNKLANLNKKYNKNFKKIEVLRFSNEEFIEILNENNIQKKVNNTYNLGKRISYPEFSSAYGKAHVFFVTHPESLGLSVLESAMSGALVVSPNSYINKDRLDIVRHIKIKDVNINWDEIFSKINIEESRNKVLDQTWENAFKKMINYLKRN